MESVVVANKQNSISETSGKIERSFNNFTVTPNLVKLLSGFAIGSFFGLGVRSALRHTRGPERAELGPSARLLGGAGFALKALGTATVLTFSGFGLLLLGISATLNVNTPRQFGERMRLLCGNSIRLNKGQAIQTLTEVFELAEKVEQSKSRKEVLVLEESEE